MAYSAPGTSARCWALVTRALRTNVDRLREISGHDAVSFHMSGTEAVMQAVRLARYHTGRTHLVRFCGAYHGWWGDVQTGNWQSGARAAHLHAAGARRGKPACARHASRHRLRAGQPAAGAASERGGTGRRQPRRCFAQCRLRSPALWPVAETAARGVHPARHRADHRRCLHGLPPRARRHAGILRRARRSRHLWQDRRRRPADWRCPAARQR